MNRKNDITMVRRLAFSVFLIILTVLVLGPSRDARGISEKKKLERERSQLIRLKKQSEKAKKKLEETIRKQKRLKKNVGKLERQLNGKIRFLKRVNRELRYVETLLDKYDKKITELKERQKFIEEAAMSATEVIYYRNADVIEPLFFSVMEERNRYMARLFVQSLDREIAGIFNQGKKIETKLDDLMDTRQYWEKKHLTTQEKKKNIETQRRKREKELLLVEKERKRIERRYRKINSNIAALQKTVAEIERKIRRKREKTVFAKTIPRGYTYPAQGTIVTRFGKVKDKEFDIYIENKGIEIKGKPGSRLRAVDDGVVVYQGNLSGFGLVTVIEHDGDIFTVYGKAALYNVNVGDKVKKGQTIGTIQREGSPIVYFELRIGGKPVNPLKYIKIPRA